MSKIKAYTVSIFPLPAFEKDERVFHPNRVFVGDQEDIETEEIYVTEIEIDTKNVLNKEKISTATVLAFLESDIKEYGDPEIYKGDLIRFIGGEDIVHIPAIHRFFDHDDIYDYLASIAHNQGKDALFDQQHNRYIVDVSRSKKLTRQFKVKTCMHCGSFLGRNDGDRDPFADLDSLPLIELPKEKWGNGTM